MRRTAREMAFMLIYEEQFNKNRSVEFSFNFLKSEEEILKNDALDIKSEEYVRSVLNYYSENKENIETLLSENLHGYELDRLYKVDKALLFLAIVEIIYMKTAPAIVINEVIEITKNYSTDKSSKFINGILGAIVKKLPQ